MSDLSTTADASPRDTAWLVLRVQAGDREALEALLERAHGLLLPFATAMLRDADQRDDVLQEVLLLIYRRLGTLRDPRAFAGWARRVAGREIFRALRAARHRERTHEEPSPDLAADPPPADDGLLERLPALLERVSPASRAVLALHYLDGLTLDETAAVLDLPPGTVRSRLAYGLAKLREAIDARA